MTRTLPALLLLAAATAVAAPRPVFPPALRGTWDADAAACRFHDAGEARITVTADRIDAYEATFTPIAIEPVSTAPRAWRVVSTEDYEGETRRDVRLFVLAGNALTATDGDYTERYVRCTTPARAR